MYLGVDVGASKTLFAVFEPDGRKIYQHKIKTSHDYPQFLANIKDVLDRQLGKYELAAWCCAIPGQLDYKNGVALKFGNFDWHNLPIKKDLAQLMPDVPLLIENDANLAGLYEAKLFEAKYQKILYLTISTGIGGGVIVNGAIDPLLATLEPGWMEFEFEGKRQKWESFASGKSFHARYGKLASEVSDEKIWREYASLVAAGVKKLLVDVRPDAVIFGGGVGAHFEKFKQFLEEKLRQDSATSLPPLIKADKPEEAVIYGCYEYIKQNI